jgi:hypothetical protein
MTNRRKIFLVAGLALLASLVALGFNFRHTVPPAADINAQSQISSRAAEPATSESTELTNNEHYLAATASTQLSQTSNQTDQASDAASFAATSRDVEAAPAAPLEDETEVYQPHLPLVFLDLTGVLPETDETAAAVQRLRQDFIDSTGAASADPADPNYAARWDQFQPIVDQQFSTMFGTEAYNALTTVEARQRGQF